jgi:hypothetical protein
MEEIKNEVIESQEVINDNQGVNVQNEENFEPEELKMDILEILKFKKEKGTLNSVEKRILDNILHPVRPVEQLKPEDGVGFIIQLLHQYPGIMLHELVKRSGFSKKKVKRLLKNKFVKEVTRFGVTKYYFVEV